MVVDDFKLSDVTWNSYHREKHDNAGVSLPYLCITLRGDQDLSLATAFSIDDVVLSFVGLSNINNRSEPETDEQGGRSVYLRVCGSVKRGSHPIVLLPHQRAGTNQRQIFG